MTVTEFMSIYNTAVMLRDNGPANVITYSMARRSNWNVEHYMLEGNGLEDYHSSDRARLMLEVGYWGTLDLG